jgi:hypothetical protein
MKTVTNDAPIMIGVSVIPILSGGGLRSVSHEALPWATSATRFTDGVGVFRIQVEVGLRSRMTNVQNSALRRQAAIISFVQSQRKHAQEPLQ